jgi:hypothetical protein
MSDPHKLPAPSLSAEVTRGVYTGRVAVRSVPDLQRRPREPGRTYHVIGVSIYTADLIGLDAKVQMLRKAGLSWMSRSELIRIAAQQVDVDAVITAHRK